MPNAKISNLTALGTQPASGDLILIVDVSDVTDAASGTTKKVVYSDIIPTATTAIQGFVEVATQAEVDAGTATGSTGASLVATPATTRAKAYHDYAADAGATDAYAITVSPAITAYATGQVFTFEANTANTGACTLAVNGLTATAIKKNNNTDLLTGDIAAGQIVQVVYDGLNFQLLSGVNTEASGSVPVVRTYLTAGSPATWTKPAGLKYVVVEVQAGGGTGANGVDNGTTGTPGGGGGGGGYSRKLIAVATLGATETVTTGAAAADSSFGTHATATKGANGSGNAGGAGGIGSSGDINLEGSDGQFSVFANDSASESGAGGSGGNSHLGGGGGGGSASTSNGSTGNVYGGGGGGGGASGNGAGTGAAGAAGIVIVTEYYA